MIKFIYFVIFTFVIYGGAANIVHYQPEQIHLSFGESSNEIVVTWTTINNAGNSIVQYGKSKLNSKVHGSSTLFVDGGPAKRSQYIHRVSLKKLKSDSKYVYRCGSNLGWSPKFGFKTPKNDTNSVYHFAIFGDMGNENAQSLGRLQEETQNGMYDAVIHVGDFAYDMPDNNGLVGDEFMKQIESVAAYAPYMVCPGNHEEKYNFSHYRARFSMPGGNENLMYSYNVGPIHFIGFSTEVYYFLNYGVKTMVKQYQWLENDLIEATKPQNRLLRPWIVTYGHRPMYCSNNNKDDCTHGETLVRVGLPFTHFFGLEELFYKYGVDLEIWAHEHSYERLWPIYDYKVFNGSREAPYTNPGAPIHIVTGSAGCKEGHDDFRKDRPEWSAFYNEDYGYTRMKVFNKTHIHFEQVSDEKNGTIVDQFWVIKHKHAAYAKTEL